jgi:hypothetical protein
MVEVSRGWYRMLETGAKVRPSIQLLDRLSQALAATPQERTTLFALGLPEVRRTIGAESRAILEAFSWVRAMTKGLWAASSESEAYSEVCSRLTEHFKKATLVHWTRRHCDGAWDRLCFTNRGNYGVTELCRDLEALMGTENLDGLMLYPQLSEPGEVGTIGDLLPDMQRARLEAYANYGLVTPELLYARVRSRAGLVAGFSVMQNADESYTATDSAVLGTLAELTSLALS